MAIGVTVVSGMDFNEKRVLQETGHVSSHDWSLSYVIHNIERRGGPSLDAEPQPDSSILEFHNI